MTRVIVRLPVLWLLLAVALGSAQPSVAQDESTSLPALSLQPDGMLHRLGLALPIENYRDTNVLRGATDIAVSGDLLFVTASSAETLSVWRVDAEAGTLSQIVVYRDGEDEIDGLNGAQGMAVSGNLLFVAGFNDNAISTWRMDTEAGTLSQIAVYRDNLNGILDGAFNVAVRGNLLFVTAFFSDALSVWRLNAEAGTLSLAEFYQDDVDGVRELTGAHGVVVSGDLLFVTARFDAALSVWRINEAADAILTLTAIYPNGGPDGAGNEVSGLRRPRGMAVSGDLLFVAASSVDSGALSVWRVNAEAGTLIQTQAVTAVFPDDSPDDSAVESFTLHGAENVAVSDNLLFLTASRGLGLSVWRVNPEAGTLTQAAAVRRGDFGVSGLVQPVGVAASGDLLFVLGGGSELSTWQIINAEVLSGVPVVIRVQSDMPVMQAVTVTVTAYNGAQRVTAQPVTLSPGTSSALAIFSPGTLNPAQWIFTAQASLPEVLDTSAVQTIVQVATLLSLDQPAQNVFEVEVLRALLPFNLTVRTPTVLETALPFRLAASPLIDDNRLPQVENFIYPAGTTSHRFTTAGDYDAIISAIRGRWQIVLEVPIDSVLTVDDSAIIPIRVFRLVRAALTLAVPEGVVTIGDAFTVTVGVTEGTPEPLPDGTAVNVTLSFRAGDGQELDREELVLTPAMPSDTATFTAPVTSGSFEVAGSGQVEETETHRVIVNAASALVTVEPVDVQLLLEFPSSLVAVSSTFLVTVGTAPELPEGSAVRVTVSLAAFTSEPVLLTPSAPTASVLVTAPAVGGEMILRATGDETPDSSGLELNVRPAELALQVQVIPTVRLQPGLQPGTDMLEREAYILPPQEVYFDLDPEIDGLTRAGAMAASSDDTLLFVLSAGEPSLSVWRVNAEAGTLSQGEIYRNGGGISGLSAPTDIAVSGDLVFVTSEFDSALSVWRVNAEAGTLSQGEVYRNNIGGVRGLFGINSVTVSRDGELLFVTSRFDNILSVWRVNAEEGTLSQNRRYQNGNLDAAGNEIRSLRGLSTTEISDDGNLLFVLSTSPDSGTGFGFSVWQINAEEATLVQLEVYRNGNQDNTGRVVGGISNPRGIAVLDNLLFVASFSDSALSVWRVNAEEGSLAQTAVYRDGLNGDVLGAARDVAVSGDGKLLFVTATSADSLGVWRVNAQAGTLSQIMVYRDGVGVDRINGLDGASRAVVSDALLFVTATDDNALSAWRINSADVLQGLPTVITVQLNRPVTKEEVVVKVTASDGTNMREAAVILPPGTSSANVTFPAGDLIPNGRWIFRAQAQPPSALNTELAQIALQVGDLLILELRLTGPEEAVTVGQTYTVTVSTTLSDSTATVPEGTILEGVPVSAGTDLRQISLQPAISSTQLIFTAPTMAGTVTVRAEQTNFQTAGSNILDSVALGTELLVTISALDVQLVLLEFPSGLVAAGSTFPVTVGVASGLPEGTAAQVTLSLVDFSSMPVVLTPSEPTASVLVTAPTIGGAQTLRATGETAAGSRLELDVLAATATVQAQVQEQVLLSLRLEPPREVEAGSIFSVTVGTNMPVPAGTEVLVTVTFAGSTQSMTLPEGMETALVMFMAPGSPTGTFTMEAAGTAEETDELRLTVNPASAQVEVVPVPIALTLTPTSIVVREDAMFSVEVGTDRDLPVGTVVEVSVQFGSQEPITVMLSDIDPTAGPAFTAPPEGLLELTAEVTRIMQGDSVVAVSDPAPVMVQVTELVTLNLEVSGPREAVEAGSTFSVTVGANAAVPEGVQVSVTVTFAGSTQTVMLPAEATTAQLMFTAPGTTTGTFTVAAAGTANVEDADALQLTVTPTSASVQVVPVPIALTLDAPDVVAGGSIFTATVGTDPVLPVGTMVEVSVQFDSQEPVTVMLSDIDPTASPAFTASPSGQLSLVASVTNVTQSSPVVAVSAPVPVSVQVTELAILSLQPGGMLTMMEHAVPTRVYFQGNESAALAGAADIAVSDDLLFVTGQTDGQLSVWRVNAQASTLVHQSDISGLGLDGVFDIVVSDDGELLYATSEIDDALSVWRVNRASGTLGRVAFYEDGGLDGEDNDIDGLRGARSIAVSGDLLFVTAADADALSVWRVNAEEDTLSQVVVYQDRTRLDRATDVAVSGDGNLLFVTAVAVPPMVGFVGSGGLSVWRVNAEAGTLTQTAFYQNGGMDDANNIIAGLFGASKVAVSGDLLFVTSQGVGVLSLWRVNAEEGTLIQTTLYQDDALIPGDIDYIEEADGRFGGLGGARSAAVSGDLLFVTATRGNALSVWRVNAEAGSLGQAALYRDGVNGIDGLGDAFDVGVGGDGDLLFVTGRADDALSVWQVNNAEGLPEVQTVIRVQSDRPVEQEVMVTVTASDGTRMETAVVTLSPEKPSDNAIFAPSLLGAGRWIFTAQVAPAALDTGAARIAISLTAEPVAVTLRLNGPAEAVSVGQVYPVIVDTAGAVPAGTTLEVTVRTGTDLQQVLLTAAIPSTQVFFTAPARAGPVTVTAMVRAQTSSGSRQVAVSDADDLTVGVSARVVRLALSEVPVDLVAAESTFSVTVSAESAVLAGTTVRVTVILAAFTSEPMLLTPGAPTASVLVTAPAAVGEVTLRATGEEADDNRLELIVLLVDAVVRVQEQVLLSLRLEAPREVEAGSTFSVTVQTDEQVPAGAEVLLMVTFAGSTQTVMLPAEATTAQLMFTAPGTTTGTFTVAAAGTVNVEDADALRVTVTPTSASVEVVPLMIALTLMPSSRVVVEAGAQLPVEVGTNRNLPGGTEVEIIVQLGSASMPAVLSVATPTASLAFTAPPEGLLELTAEVTRIMQGDPVVAVSDPAPVMVQVTELVTLGLTLNAPERVEAGSIFSVTVGANAAVPAGAEVLLMVTFAGSTQTVMLLAEATTAQLMFTAPGRPTGTYTVDAIGTANVEDPNSLQLTVNPTSAEVEVVPVPIALQLTAPGVVDGDSLFTVTVGTEPVLPVGTMVDLIVQFGEATTMVTLSGTMASVEFTSPPEGLLDLTAQVSGITQSSPVVSVSVPALVSVQVTELVTVELTLSTPGITVEAGSQFSVTVSSAPEVPEGAEVSVMVTFEGNTTQVATLSADETTATVMFMAPGRPTGTYTVNAIGTANVEDPNSLQLTVNPTSAEVEVVPVPIALQLTAPGVVDGDSLFTVTVGTEPVLPVGTMVDLMVQFGEATTMVTLSGMTASVMLMAPSSGLLDLTAQVSGITQSSPVVSVSVPALVSVQVTELVTVELTLSTPGITVEAGSQFSVTVSSAPEVPEGAEVSVMVTFEGNTTQVATLSADETTATVMFMAPGRPTGTYTVNAIGTANVEDPNSLQLTVNPTSAEVEVVPVPIALQLTAPGVVDGDSLFTVTVGTEPVLPVGTMVDLMVQFGEATTMVTLSGMTASVMLMAPSSGLLDLTAQVSGITQSSPVVSVSVPALVSVQVTELVTLGLTLNAPERVEAGSTFSVTVGANAAVPEGVQVSVMVTFAGSTQTVMLPAEATTAQLMFTAPGTTGTFTVAAAGTVNVEDADALRVTVTPTSASVEVVPLMIALTLMPSSRVVVEAGAQLPVEVGTNRNLPGGTEVEIIVQLGSASMPAVLSVATPPAWRSRRQRVCWS